MINPQSKKQPVKADKTAPSAVPVRSVRWRAVFISSSAVFLLLLAGLTGYAFYLSHRILPHTEIAGVKVGGLTEGQALERLKAKEQDFQQKTLTLSYQDKTWQVKTADLDLAFNNQPAIKDAYNRGKTGSIGNQIQTFFLSLVKTATFKVQLADISEKGQTALSKQVLADIETPVSETTLSFAPADVQIVPGKAGQKLEYPRFHEAVYAAFVHAGDHISLTLTSFAPTVSPAQAEPARVLAEEILSNNWILQADKKSLTIQTSDIANWLGTEPETIDGAVVGLKLTVKSDDVTHRVTEFAKTVDTKPVNALLKEDKGAIVVAEPAQAGQNLEVPQTVQAIVSAFLKSGSSHTLTASLKTTPADLREDTIANLGIKELLGSATTDFSGSPTNRVHNIRVGQESLNGGLVKDGEEYSTTGTLGPVDQAHGYLPELVIKGNRTIPEDGGGLCQVSTTLFRAVLNAGLPVTDRTNHSYRVGYYERNVGPGLDATVYIPNPDFKWKNDTGHAVYVQSYMVGNKITFELYGTSDGRVASIDGPRITEVIPVGAPIYADTDTLYVGQTKQVETAHNGARTTATYTVTRGGEQINQQVFNSYYKPWPAQFLRGTKPRA